MLETAQKKSWIIGRVAVAIHLLSLLAFIMAADKERLLASYKAAVTAHQSGELDTALGLYREVLAMQQIPAVHNNVAAILLSRGEKDAAESSWRSAVELKPDYAEAHYNLAVVLSEKSGDHLSEAREHCQQAITHKEGYVQAHHLMGNIRMSQGAHDEAAKWYAKAEAMADGGSSAATATQQSSTAASSSSSAAAPASYRWDGVEVGHIRTLQLPDGSSWVMRTLSLNPLAFLVDNFLKEDECERLIELARPKLKGSLMMGNATGSERTSSSVFLQAVEDGLLTSLQSRLSALTQLPLAQVTSSEDIQVVHYTPGAQFGMHHDSSRFLPRLLTAFYYLNDVESGGETAFPAADGAMQPSEAMALTDPAAHGKGLVVTPRKGSALLWYNHDENGAIDPFAVHAGCKVTSGEKWGANHWVKVDHPPGGAAGAVHRLLGSSGADPPADGAGGDDAKEAAEEASGGAGKNAAKNKKKREKAAAKKREEKEAAATAAEEVDVS